VSEPAVLDLVIEVLPPGWRPASSQVVDRLYSLVVGGPGGNPKVRRFSLLYADDARLAREMDLAFVLKMLELDLQLYIAEFAPHRVFVHAGVVGWRDRAIVLPGKSFSGKSTLVAALVRSGATYYSDEYALFDAHGRVHPFARPLALRQKKGEWASYLPGDLGAKVGRRPLPVGLVAITRYRSGARWRPRLLSAGDGALELLANAAPARSRPEMAIGTLRKVALGAHIVKGVRGEAQEMAERLLQMSESGPQHDTEPQHRRAVARLRPGSRTV
jgi:hypothetical protein